MKPTYGNVLPLAVGFLGYTTAAVDARLLQDAPLVILTIPDPTTTSGSLAVDEEIEAELEEALETDGHVTGENERVRHHPGQLVSFSSRTVSLFPI